MVFLKQGMKPKKTKIIKEWPAPEEKAAVKYFLGTSQLSAVFMTPGQNRTYADVTLSLRSLTVQNVKIQWTDECNAVVKPASL